MVEDYKIKQNIFIVVETGEYIVREKWKNGEKPDWCGVLRYLQIRTSDS